MNKTSALVVAGSLLFGVSGAALAGPSNSEPAQQLTQAQPQNRSTMDQDYQQRQRAYQERLSAAKTPEERARIQAEWDRTNQQGQLPPSSGTVRTGPGTSEDPQNRQQPSGGGAVPRGQAD